MQSVYEYPRANITTDILYIHPHKGILLIKRKNYPDAGKWALPGGHLEIDEKIKSCAKREFMEEVGFEPLNLFILRGVFDEIRRDPRDRYLTFAFFVNGHLDDPEPIAGDDASACCFFDVDKAKDMDLAIDHKNIISNILFGCFKSTNVLC